MMIQKQKKEKDKRQHQKKRQTKDKNNITNPFFPYIANKENNAKQK